MARRNIFLLDKETSPWPSFFEEFFNETRSVMHFFDNSMEAGKWMDKHSCDVFFAKDELLSQSMIQKLKAHSQIHPNFRFFTLLANPPMASGSIQAHSHAHFEEPLIYAEFQKKLTQQLPHPESLRITMVDDEPEISAALRDYMEGRKQPSFQISTANNGKAGLEMILRDKPDVVLLDVKMPEMTGIEVYRELMRQGLEIPVIIYFDAIFGDEVIELHKIGQPAIVEKGSKESAVSDMMGLILKMAYFG